MNSLFSPNRALLPMMVFLAAPAAAQTWTLDRLAFLSGCWEGSFGNGGMMEEIYSAPSANLIVGTTRYMRGERTVQFEFSRVERDSSGTIWLIPYPNGRASEHPFRLTSLSDAEAIFEAPEHDYPKRIIYRRPGDGTRIARIDGGAEDTGGQQWVLRPVACPTARP